MLPGSEPAREGAGAAQKSAMAAPPGPPARIALMLQRFAHYGGVEQFGWRLAEALARKGYAVDFICARQESAPPAGVNVIAVGRYGGLRFLKYLWFLIRAEQVRKKGRYDLCFSLAKTWTQDIIRIGGGPLQSFWRLSDQAWAPGLPRRWKQLTRRMRLDNWLTLLVEKRFYRATPCIVAISDSVRDWILQEYPHLKDAGKYGQEVLTVYNCPDVSRFQPPVPEQREKARKALGVRQGSYVLGLATTNFALKGVDSLIRSLALLPIEVELHIAGGRDPGRYQQLAVSMGLGQRVRFHGKVDDMAAFYHGLDMYVHPSFYDTLGNVVLEALGSGLKTLCSDRAGASAFLPPDQVIRDPSDPAEIAAKVTLLRGKRDVPPFAPKGAGIDDLVRLVGRKLAEKTASKDDS